MPAVHLRGTGEEGSIPGITEEQQRSGSVSAAISNAVVQIMHEYTGRGPTKARTTVNVDSVLVVLGDTMTKAERNLVANGKSELVLEVRREFQAAMSADLVAKVEELTARRVTAFMSANHIDPDMGCEIFVLEPLQDGDGSHS